jgi:tRNA(Ile)-lysidine synthase
MQQKIKDKMTVLGVTKSHKLLLAISGGIDSMFLCDILLKNNYDFALCHCNFILRSAESDQDEAFVRGYAEKKNLPIFIARFDTKEYAKEHKLSIQEAARELRYNFFAETAEKNNFDFILTAHNLDDKIESFFINLLRSSGIKGLAGIPEKNANIIRPILAISREEISQYMRKERIPFREDSSNSETKYLRNKLRHIVLAELENVQKDYRSSISKSIDYLHEAHCFQKAALQKYFVKLIRKEDDAFYIDKKALLKEEQQFFILFHFLKDYGFNAEQCRQILEGLVDKNNLSGKAFYSDTYFLQVERSYLKLAKQQEKIVKQYLISSFDMAFSFENKKIVFSQNPKISSLKTDKNSIFIDLDKVKFPLIIRTWEKGDRIYPYGMKGSKLISDIFTDLKFSKEEKQAARILCNKKGEIIWIIGHRADRRFGVNKESKNILQLSLVEY